MAGGGHAWWGACMVGGMHGRGVHGRGVCMAGSVCGKGLCRGRYASYWNAFLLNFKLVPSPFRINNYYNSGLQHGLEFDCNYEALLEWDRRLLIDFNVFRNYMQFADVVWL